MSLLHLDSSVDRADNSVSRQLTGLFAETWRRRHPAAGYRYRDLAATPVPMVGCAYVSLGTRVERQGVVPLSRVTDLVADAAEADEWALTRPLVDELREAATLLVGVPMYNFSVPATLKAWIDRVSFPGAFLDPHTGRRLLHGTRVVLVTAQGGSYAPGAPREGFDFQTPYLRAYFTNLGVAPDDLCLVNAELTRSADIPALAGYQQRAAESRDAARAAVSALASGRWPRSHRDGAPDGSAPPPTRRSPTSTAPDR